MSGDYAMAKSEWKPGCPIWEESPDNKRSRAQHKRVLAQIIDNDHKRLPCTEMVRGWHRELFVGVEFQSAVKTLRCM
jgi:hypothetical protein